MEDINDIMSMMQKVEVPRDRLQINETDSNSARVTHHKEDMLTVKGGDVNWQFGKVLSIYGAGNKSDALIVGIKEFSTNALLLRRSPSSLVDQDLKFEMPSSFFVNAKWGHNQSCLTDEQANVKQTTSIDLQ